MAGFALRSATRPPTLFFNKYTSTTLISTVIASRWALAPFGIAGQACCARERARGYGDQQGQQHQCDPGRQSRLQTIVIILDMLEGALRGRTDHYVFQVDRWPTGAGHLTIIEHTFSPFLGFPAARR